MFGANAGLTAPAEGPENDPNPSDLILNSRFGSIQNLSSGCTSSGMPVSCAIKEFADQGEQEYWRIRGQIATDRERRNNPGPLMANAAHEAGHAAAAFAATSPLAGSSAGLHSGALTDETIYGAANGESFVTVRASLFDDDVSDGFLQTNETPEQKRKRKVDEAVAEAENILNKKGGDNDCAKYVVNLVKAAYSYAVAIEPRGGFITPQYDLPGLPLTSDRASSFIGDFRTAQKEGRVDYSGGCKKFCVIPNL